MEWISLKDREPDTSEDVIVFLQKKGNTITIAYRTGEYWRLSWDATIIVSTITHWHPLPDPPQNTNNQ